jgi:Domain of unknown function (DUF4349)
MYHKTITAIAVAAILLTACTNRASQYEQLNKTDNKAEMSPTDSASIPIAAEPAPKQPGAKASSDAPAVQEDWDKKIIKTAQLNLEVKEFDNFTKQVKALFKNYGAYVAAEQQVNGTDRTSNTLTVKVPVHLFDDAVTALCALPVTIIDKQVSTQDVSAEMVDTKARIEAKKHLREKYLDFLKQSKNMEEALRVQEEINDLQELIEAAAGRVNYLGHATAFSTITLSYYQLLQPGTPTTNPEGFGTKMQQAMGYGWDIIKGIVLAGVTIWPLLVLALVGWVWYRRRSKKVPSNAQQPR